MLHSVAERAHGYVGADLSAVCKEAGLLAMKRLLLDAESIIKKDKFSICLKDLEDAMLKVRPSAMRSINLDVPVVSWDDVGGQVEVKKRLKEIVEWPLKYPEVCFYISTMAKLKPAYFETYLYMSLVGC